MLASRMAGQLQTGDSFAIWTFDETLHTGQFPLHDWSRDSAPDVMLASISFLDRQKYTGIGKMDTVLTALDGVIKSSQRITVILVSDGAQQILGTPFDEPINGEFGRWQVEQQRQKMPMVTVLCAKAGVYTGFSVAPLPWPIKFPL